MRQVRLVHLVRKQVNKLRRVITITPHIESMDVRARTATLFGRFFFRINLRVFGFAPRQFGRWASLLLEIY